MIETMKVKPWGEGQGEFVIINAEDFDPAVHTALDGEAPAPEAPAEPAPELPPASAEKPVPKRRVKSRRRKGAR